MHADGITSPRKAGGRGSAWRFVPQHHYQQAAGERRGEHSRPFPPPPGPPLPPSLPSCTAPAPHLAAIHLAQRVLAQPRAARPASPGAAPAQLLLLLLARRARAAPAPGSPGCCVTAILCVVVLVLRAQRRHLPVVRRQHRLALLEAPAAPAPREGAAGRQAARRWVDGIR